MAAEVKGISIQLDADVTGVKKAFRDLKSDSREVEGQLKDVNRALKFDPQNTTLLESKQKLLAQAIEKTAGQLEKAQQAQQAFVDAGGDVDSQQYIQMQIETERLAGHLSDLQSESDATAAALENTGEAAEEGAAGANDMAEASENAANSSGAWEVAIGNLISNGIQKLVSSLSSAISSTMQLTDDVATLANNYGITQEAAYTLYQNQGLLDYSVSSVTKGIREQYEALANGTEAYDRLGIVVRDASGQLLSQEQIWAQTIVYLRGIDDPVRRASEGVELLGNKYYDLGGILNATDADFESFVGSLLGTDQELRDNIEGMNKYNDAMDRLHNAMTDLVIGLGTFFGWLAELKGLLPVLAILIAGATAAWLAFGGAAKLAAVAQGILNAIMLANPIGLMIIAITALIAIMYLLIANCEAVRDAFKKVGETIIEWVNAIGTFGEKITQGLYNGIKKGLQKIVDLVQEFWNWLTGLLSQPIGVNVALGAYGGINGSHANGLDYVPFDGYVAELHRGERVLTAAENARYSNPGSNDSGQQTIKVNINYGGSLAQLAAVLQPEIQAETVRRGSNLVRA